MNAWKALSNALAAATLALTAAAASAAPVTLSLRGVITGYDFIDFSASAGLPVGTAVDLTLTFNETWSDGTYDFADAIGPVSGSATVGANAFSFTGADPFSYSETNGAVNWVTPIFTGSGPTLGGGEFFGLFATITPALTLQRLALGYGFTSGLATSYGYALISLDDYTIAPVPEPHTLALLAAGLFGIGGATRRRRSIR
jgi:hypothetical protein